MRSNRKFPRYVKLELERLESREAPSVSPWTTESFEGIAVSPPGSPPSLPLNWTQRSSNSNSQFSVTASPPPPLSGTKTFTVNDTNGTSNAITRTWLNQTMPADVEVSAAVYVNSLIPAQVIARGSNLDPTNGDGASFYAVQLSSGSPGPKLSLVKDVNGTSTTLVSINAPNYLNNDWLVETLDVEGSTVRAQLFDPSTGDYLYNNNGTGQWQTTQAWALTVIDNSVTGPGVVGLGRPSSYVGNVTFDDFSVQTPATDQSFDATPVGQLPENWTSYASRSGATIAVAAPTNPTPTSPPNALAITPVQSTDTDRAWLNTSLPADLSVSAETYLDTLTPAQVFARGNNLNSPTSVTYYAVEVSRGYLSATLLKVVNGTETDLGTVSSTSYVQNVWVQETLGLSGNTLEEQIYRTDTDKYLKSDGSWQSTPTWAKTVTDTSIPGSGQAGVARPVAGGYVEIDYFDDFTTATGMDAQNFDSSTSLSSNEWSQWSSDGKNNYFSAAAAPDSNHFLSANNVLESTGATSISAKIWDANDSLTNAQVSAGLYVVSAMPPVQVIARGTYLNTSTPNYYGLSVTPTSSGLKVDLVRVNSGTSTTLAEISPLSTYTGVYFSGQWIQATLYFDGPSIRVQIYRADTGQYLNNEDMWQSAPTYALNYTDTSPSALAGPGSGGLARLSGGSSTVYFDNFAVAPLYAENTPPSVSINVPGGTLSGPVTVGATATDDTGISKVDFYVEDITNPATPTIFTHWEETAGSSYNWNLDTTFVPNGTHWLVVQAYDEAGNMGEAMTSVTISNNTALSLPSGFPTHTNTSVGITELDYTSDNADPNLVQNYVDTVVGPNPTDATNIHNWDSSVQQLAYTNVSNIYGDSSHLNEPSLLTDWLNYAEENGIDPEEAFYHVSAATAWSGQGGSTLPVDWFWAVYGYQNGTWSDLTAAAHAAPNTTGVPFGSGTSMVGDTLNVGYTDKFREMDINVSTARSGGSYVLEYPTAVDSYGNPTTWTTLTTLSDTTNGLTQSGAGIISFDPPSNWVPAVVDASVNNPPRYYYVRFRTTAAFSTIPVASKILGYNYTGANSDGSGNVTGSYTIPAFDYAADKDGDGYLNAQEYANRAPGMDAYFAYQGRLFFYPYGQMRYVTNPSSPDFRQWALSYYKTYLTSTQYATGLFMDNSLNNPPGLSGNYSVVEPTDSYTQDYASLLNAIGLNIASVNGWIIANTNGANPTTNGDAGQTNADPVIQRVQAFYEEKGLRAVTDDTTDFQSFYAKIYYRDNNDDNHDSPVYSVLDSTSSSTWPEQNGQTQLTTLAAYYLLAPTNPSKGALDFFGGEQASTPWVSSWSPPPGTFNHWSQAATYNVGTPEGPLPSAPVVLNEPGGTGTESDGSTYYVYERQYTGQNNQPVLVLYKPISMLNGNASTLSPSASATTATLPGSYYVLQADGTLSSTTATSISLENGQGVILVDPSTGGTAPLAIAGTTMVTASIPASPVAQSTSSQYTSGSSIDPGSLPPTNSKQITAEFFDGWLPTLFLPNATSVSQAPLVWPADPFASWSELGRFFSAWVTAKLLETHANSSPFDESLWPAGDAVAASPSDSLADDPITASSVS